MRLSGKVAVITGAASGQAAAAARRFSEEGASIALLDWNGDQGGAMERELADADRSAVFHQLDISDDQAVADTITAVHERFGYIDVLFNNTGIGYSPMTPTRWLRCWTRRRATDGRFSGSTSMAPRT